MSNQHQKTSFAKGVAAIFYSWQYLLFLAPLLILIVLSLFSFENYHLSPQPTIEHYKSFLNSPTYLQALFNTVILGFGAGAVAILLGYGFCLAVIYFIPKRFQWPIILSIVVPLLTNFVLRAFSWRLILSDNGILNAIFSYFGLEFNFLFHPLTVMFGVAMYALPFVIFVLYITLVNIPRGLIAVAENLGASWGAALKRVIIPLSFRGTLLSLVIVFVFAFSDFVTPTILGGSSFYTLSMHLTDTQRVSNIPQTAALGVLILLPALFVVAFLIVVVEKAFNKKHEA